MAVNIAQEELRQQIIASQGDHAIFSPSSSAGWLYCADYIFANYGKPDTANYDAAYGTVGHSVGEAWLKNYKTVREEFPGIDLDTAVSESCPYEMIGQVQKIKGVTETFEIEIDQEMVSYVEEYVRACAVLPGEHFIETRIDFSDLTPIPNQGGTADHCACERQLMTITDLKMGQGIRVFAERNTQALLYAYGFFREYDWIYNFQRIVIRIAQPRLEHFKTWEVSREELLEFAEWAKDRAAKAWEGGERCPSPKSCQWCKDVECGARLAALHEETDDVWDDVSEQDDVIEGEFRVVTEKQIVVAKTALDEGWRPDGVRASQLSTLQLEKLLRLRKSLEKWLGEIAAELEHRALDGEELAFFKIAKGRQGNREFISEEEAEAWCVENGVDPLMLYKTVLLSPAQFTEVVRQELGIGKKKAEQLLSSAVIRAPGRDTLVPVSDEREAISPGDEFDDLTIDGL